MLTLHGAEKILLALAREYVLKNSIWSFDSSIRLRGFARPGWNLNLELGIFPRQRGRRGYMGRPTMSKVCFEPQISNSEVTDWFSLIRRMASASKGAIPQA